MFDRNPDNVLVSGSKDIYVFGSVHGDNIDEKTVAAFGEEWSKFNNFSEAELTKIGNDYFDLLPKELEHPDTRVLDLGCGTGRWAAYVSQRVGFIECIDPSDAVFAASRLLAENPKVRISKADVDNIPFPDNSFDLVYSLGVLHHIPDTKAAMMQCVKKVKPGGYFLVYLYYKLENRGMLFRTIFHLANKLRQLICRFPITLKKVVCDIIAALVYLPLARTAGLLRRVGLKGLWKQVPLSYYSDKSFWIMQNDALDRFGTPLEQRFSRMEIEAMMKACGLVNIIFSEKEPYWHAIGQKV